MAEKKREKLFSDFPANTKEEWMGKITIDLKGADFDRKLVWKTNEGFNVQPMYRREDLKDLKYLDCFPGEFPFVRGNKKDGNDWFIRQDIPVRDVSEANKKALDVLNKGVDSIGFLIEDGGTLTKAKIKELLEGIHLESIEINFVVAHNKSNVLANFTEFIAESGINPEDIRGGINIDPLSKLILRGRFNRKDPYSVAKNDLEISAALKNFKVLEIGGYLFNNSGSSIVQELGFSLAAAVEYLDRMTDYGMKIEDIAPRMRFHFATGSKYFMEIAKLRAARYLWSQIVNSYNPPCNSICRINIHAETSEWNKTVYDSSVNMLRTQTETMSAVLGGVDSFTTLPYDYIYECQPSELGERVARNQQLLLKEEAHFNKIVDAAGGSYYIEELTQSIIEAAWNLFLEVQDKGGYEKAVREGFVQETIKTTASKRNQAIATRRENFLGTNQFPNFSEMIKTPLCRSIFEPENHTEPDAEVETLKPYRGTQAFEIMRMKTDQFATNNHRPVVYMLPMGNLTMRKARSQFACNFFACAGFEVIDNNGFETVEEGAKAATDNKADIVVVCSSDDEYATIAPEVYKVLKDLAIIVVAGNPGSKTELEAQGITNFISVKSNLLDELKEYQSKLGIK